MAEKLDIEKLKNDHPDFFKMVGPEVLEFMLSKETSNAIANICFENDVLDEKNIEKIAHHSFLTFLQQTPKENLIITLKKEAGLSLDVAKKITNEIDDFLLSNLEIENESDSSTQKAKTDKDDPTETKTIKNDQYQEPLG
jgi:hypothetical protein